MKRIFRILSVAFLTVVPLGCAMLPSPPTGPIVQHAGDSPSVAPTVVEPLAVERLPAPMAFRPVLLDSVKLVRSVQVPSGQRVIGRYQSLAISDTAVIRELRERAASWGATAVLVRPGLQRGTEYLLIRDATRADAWADQRAALDAGASSTSGAGHGTAGGSSGGCVSNCTVNVRGYTRKDGTYVRPHTRSAPRSRRP
jgi:hypothetical protein